MNISCPHLLSGRDGDELTGITVFIDEQLEAFGDEAVDLSTRFPLVAGFYHLVSLLLKIYGNDLAESSRSKYHFYISSVIDRLAQLSDDLLSAAVEVFCIVQPFSSIQEPQLDFVFNLRFASL